MTKNATKRRAPATRTGGAGGRRATEAPTAPVTMPPSGERRRALIEDVAIGAFEPTVQDGEMHKASTATMLVAALSPVDGHDPVPNALEQLALELDVLGSYLLESDRSPRLRGETLYNVVQGYATRLQVIAAIARRTLAASDEREPA